MNRWRLWSGIASCVLGIMGYIFLVYLCVSGIIPLDLNMDYSDMFEMMEQMDESVILQLGRSAGLVELLAVAGIVSIIGHNKRWYWNIPVALMTAQAAINGFMGYKYLYAIAVWAAVCLFMSIVAMRSGYRALHDPEAAAPAPQPDEASQAPQAPQAPQASQASQASQAPQASQVPQAPGCTQPAQDTEPPRHARDPWCAPAPQQKDIPEVPAAPEDLQAAQTPQDESAPETPASSDDAAINIPPRAIPIDDYGDWE